MVNFWEIIPLYGRKIQVSVKSYHLPRSWVYISRNYLLGNKLLTYHGWWFQTFVLLHNILYGIVLPIDELMFFKMVIAPPSSIMGIEYIPGCKIWVNITRATSLEWIGIGLG